MPHKHALTRMALGRQKAAPKPEAVSWWLSASREQFTTRAELHFATDGSEKPEMAGVALGNAVKQGWIE